MRIQILGVILLLAACTKAASNVSTSPPASQANLTGTWQAQIDAGSRTALLQYILIEDAGALSGRTLINDPSNATEFHTLDTLSGTHNNATVTLQTVNTGDTINATFDGGTLAGVDPFSVPLIFRDGGPSASLNVPFSMTRISTNAPIPDAGDFQ